jgi:hypothetical protein
LNLPGGRLGIPRHNATAFGGGRMSTIYEADYIVKRSVAIPFIGHIFAQTSFRPL